KLVQEASMTSGMSRKTHGLLGKIVGHQLRPLSVQLAHADISLSDVRAGVSDGHFIMLDRELLQLLLGGFALIHELDKRMTTDVELICDAFDFPPKCLGIHT